MQQWYAVQVRGEKRCNQELLSRNVETFFPRVRIRKIKYSKGNPFVRWEEKPAYPGYVFCRITKRQVRLVKAIPNVRGFVQFGDDGPEPIPDAVMTIIRAGCDANGIMCSRDETIRKRFEAMQAVRLTEGAWADVLARVEADDGKEFVTVLLKAMGAERKVRVRARSLVAA
jgi:transcriptional antiterminator RfaH